MLAIDAKEPTRRVTPNILPCTIKHNGPVDAEKRHWAPCEDDDGQPSTAYFRGRKLRGRTVKVPEGYQGIILQKTDKILPPEAPSAEQLRRMEEEEDHDGEEDVEMAQPAEVKMMEAVATFDQVMVWGHEAVPEEDDEYVKGIEEWIGFAEAMHLSDKRSTGR